MEPHLDGHAHASPHVGKAGRVSACRRLTHGHDAESLDGGERGGFILVQQPSRLFEEVVACGPEVVWVCPGGGFVGEVASVGKDGVDQQGAAVLLAAGAEVLVETLAGEDDVEGVGPAEVQVQQALDKGEVLGDGGPGRVALDARAALDGGGVVIVFGHQRQVARVAKVAALARLGHGGLAQQHGQLALQRLGLERGGRRQGECLAPGVGQGLQVEGDIFADVLDQVVDVSLGQAADGGDEKFGVVVGGRRSHLGGRWSDGRSIALGAGLCAAALALSVVVAWCFVNGCACRTVGRPAIALFTSRSVWCYVQLAWSEQHHVSSSFLSDWTIRGAARRQTISQPWITYLGLPFPAGHAR